MLKIMYHRVMVMTYEYCIHRHGSADSNSTLHLIGKHSKWVALIVVKHTLSTRKFPCQTCLLITLTLFRVRFYNLIGVQPYHCGMLYILSLNCNEHDEAKSFE